jgi:putative copper resistance protein D
MTGDFSTVQCGATVVLFLAAALAAGAGISTLWLSRSGSHWAAERIPGLRRCALAGAAVALLATLAVLCLESAAMAEVPLAQAAPAVVAMLRSTHYGAVCCVGAVTLAGAVVLNLVMPQRLSRYTAMGTLAALAVFWYTRSIVSHAASDGDLSLLLVADWVHLILVSLWLGEVFVAGLMIMRGAAPEREDDRRSRADYIAALSSSASLGLAGIFATGLFGAWHNLGTIGDLVGNAYGNTLLAKLAVVGIAALLGGFNRFLVMPAWLACETAGLPAPASLPRRFRLVLHVEALVLLSAMILAVVLAATSPPAAAL